MEGVLLEFWSCAGSFGSRWKRENIRPTTVVTLLTHTPETNAKGVNGEKVCCVQKCCAVSNQSYELQLQLRVHCNWF